MAEKHTPAKVVIIPIRAQIAKPELYILRRGLKEAIEQKVDTIVLDMETPGGALDVTFEMLKALEKFPGKTVTYINREAISAGALISAGTDEIYFAPGGVIGAAAPVLATGGEIDETMRDKIVSYLKARVRSISEGKGYRGEVISAMIDIESELKIGDEVIKPKGELLSLTAQEAVKLYGDPPKPLLGAGIADNMDALLDQLHGAGNHSAIRLEVTWSEKLAQYLTALTPLLLAGGLLCLFIEFKTPGFGIFGIAGILLLGVVFFGHYVAGLSGYEPLLFFLLGVTLVAIEVFFFPGMMILGAHRRGADVRLAGLGDARPLAGRTGFLSGRCAAAAARQCHGRRGDGGGAVPRAAQVPAQRRPVGRHGAGNRRGGRTRRHPRRSMPPARTRRAATH